MPKGEFIKKTTKLMKDVGDGKIEAKVVVDQVYAKFQHESLDLGHPHGGGAKYLTKALMQNKDKILRDAAGGVLRGQIREAFAVGAERIASGVQKNAPKELNYLRQSAHPTVKDRGRFTYNRPPAVKRLTKSQLKAKDRARGRR